MHALIEENPAYQAVTIMRVDWGSDDASRAIADELDVWRRSTLVMFKGKEEIGRVIASTREEDIEALFRDALAAPGQKLQQG